MNDSSDKVKRGMELRGVEENRARQESLGRKETEKQALCVLFEAPYPLNPKNNPCPVCEGAQRRKEREVVLGKKRETEESGPG